MLLVILNFYYKFLLIETPPNPRPKFVVDPIIVSTHVVSIIKLKSWISSISISFLQISTNTTFDTFGETNRLKFENAPSSGYVVTLTLGSRTKQRGYKVAGQEEARELKQKGCKGAGQGEAQESHHIFPWV